MSNRYLTPLAAAALFAAVVNSSMADVVETKSGARLVGKVAHIEEGMVTLITDYAGKLTIKQSEVTGLQTDEKRFVRMSGGTVMEGTVTPVEGGKIQITGEDGMITTSVEKVAASWSAGEKDPAVAKLETKWQYELGADVAGKTGNSEQLGTAFYAMAKRVGPTDTLKFYSLYNRQTSKGSTSTDQFKAGLDYSDHYSERKSWYVRDEAGFDRVKGIDLFNVAGAGLGYDFIKFTHQLLTGRFGLSFRYEGYQDPASDDVKSLGLDLGVHHEYTFSTSKLVNDLTFVPGFDDFTNYRAQHESYFEIPLQLEGWKLRVGITNDYSSQVGVGVEKLDTTYFTRFVLNLK